MISGIIINYIKGIVIWIIYMDEKVIETSLQPKKHNRILIVLGAMISLLGSMQLINYCS
jgi:hypothetical protein